MSFPGTKRVVEGGGLVARGPINNHVHAHVVLDLRVGRIQRVDRMILPVMSFI